MAAVNKPRPPLEGDGWLLEYVCVLLKTFFNGRPEYVWDELPLIEGLIYFQWALNNDVLAKLFGVERIGKSFVAMEAEKLIKQAVDFDPKWKQSA